MPDKGYIAQLKYLFVLVSLLISIELWSFSLIPDTVFVNLQFLNSLVILAIVVYHYKRPTEKMLFRNNVLLFLVIQVVAGFAALHFHNQDLKYSFLLMRGNLFWLFYFALHLLNVPTRKVIQIIIICGAIWAFLTIVQQFTYPTYYFYTRSDNEQGSILRGGVYRFMLQGLGLGAFMTFYCFHRYLTTRSLKPFAFFVLGIVGIYYFGTRQYAITAAACLLFATLLVKGRAKIYAFSFVALASLMLMVFGGALFDQYVELTKEQWKYGEDIRQLCARFYLYEYWPHWTAKLTGNGAPHKASPYGVEMEWIKYYFHFYRSDVGVIGGFNAFGIFYVLNIIWLNLKGFSAKYYLYEDRYLRLFYLNAMILMVTSEGYSNPSAILIYSTVFYLTDKAYAARRSAREAAAEPDPEPEQKSMQLVTS